MKVGDRVIVNGEQDGIEFDNAAGTIIDIDDIWGVYCIEFEEYTNLGTYFGGKPGHCWRVPKFMTKGDNMKERIEALEKELAALKAQFGKKYEPKMGQHYICGTGEICKTGITDEIAYVKTGRAFDTKEKAEKAGDIMVKHDIILKYVIDHAPDYEPDWNDFSEQKWFVMFDVHSKTYQTNFRVYTCPTGIIFMPEWGAEKLSDDLNNNRIEGM